MASAILGQASSRAVHSTAVGLADDLVSPLLDDRVVSDTASGALGGNASVSKETKGDLQNSDNDEVMLTSGQILKSIVVLIVSAAGTAASVASFLVAPEIIVYVAGGMCIFHVPFVLYKERRMSKIPTLRSTNNDLLRCAEALKEQVDLLQNEADDLTEEAGRVQEVEGELLDITKRQGSNVNNLVDLVKENEEIMHLMKENLRQKVLQDVIRIVVGSDRDNDLAVDKVEARLLALKISVALGSYGIVFDEEKFSQAVSLNPKLIGVLSVVRKLIPGEGDTKPKDDDESDEDDVYDMFYMSKDDHPSGGSITKSRSKRSSKRRLSLAVSQPNVRRR